MPHAPARELPRWRTDAFLAAAYGLNYAARGVLPVILPAVRLDFRLSDAALGLLGAFFFYTYAVSAPFGGILGDMFSRRLLILISLVGWSVTTLLAGAATGFVMLLVLRAAFGLSESFYLPAATALQADHHGPETLTRALGLNTLAQQAGPVVGAAMAGYIAERWGWRWSFAAMGLAGIALAAASPRFLGNPPHRKDRRPPPRAKVGEALAYLFRNPTYLLLDLNEFICGVAVWILFFWLPTFLLETYGIKMAQAGFAGMAMQQLSGMVGVALGTWLAHRMPKMVPRTRLLFFGATSTVAGPFMLCFLFHPSYLAVIVAVSIFSLLRAFGGVYELGVLCDVVPAPYRATAVGLLVAGANLAGGLGVAAAGALKKSLGLTGIFGILSAILTLAGLTLMAGYWWSVRRDTARAEAWERAAAAAN